KSSPLKGLLHGIAARRSGALAAQQVHGETLECEQARAACVAQDAWFGRGLGGLARPAPGVAETVGEDRAARVAQIGGGKSALAVGRGNAIAGAGDCAFDDEGVVVVGAFQCGTPVMAAD